MRIHQRPDIRATSTPRLCALLALGAVFTAAALPAAAADLVVDGTTETISGLRDVDGVYVINGGKLILDNATLRLNLDYDEHRHIEISGNSTLDVRSSLIESVGGQYSINLANVGAAAPRMLVSGTSKITNHTGIGLFDDARIDVTGGDIEELQMHGRAQASVTNASLYPVFFFEQNTTTTLDGLASGTVTRPFTSSGGWRLQLTNANVVGYQVDVLPNASVILRNCSDAVLSIHTPGTLDGRLRILDRITGIGPYSALLNDFGSSISIENTQVSMLNIYTRGTDRVLVQNSKVNEANAEEGSELIVGRPVGRPGVTTQTQLVCNLCQVYDRARLDVVSAAMVADAGRPSATSSPKGRQDLGRGTLRFANTDLQTPVTNLTAVNQGTLLLDGLPLSDPGRVRVVTGSTPRIEARALSAHYTADRLRAKLGEPVNFIDLSAGDVSSWSWDFGDGNVSSEREPSHAYSQSGLYTVRLTVRGASGSAVSERLLVIEVIRDVIFADGFEVLPRLGTISGLDAIAVAVIPRLSALRL
ncbi:PKD domain-containing protein [Dokdonella soli]|uniref:PKD domain-containing protein n=1 Tax=Dokdonella soli TaxID=529810 RepID=A0ABP3U5X6_9GAMM